MNDLSVVNNTYKVGVPVGLVARPAYLDWDIPEFYKTFPACPVGCHTLGQIFEYVQLLKPDQVGKKQEILDFAVRIAQRMVSEKLEDLKIYMATRNPPINLSIQPPDPVPTIFETNIKIVNLVKYHEHNESCPPIPRRHRHCTIL